MSEEERLLLGKLRIQVKVLQELAIYLAKKCRHKTPKLPSFVFEVL